MIVRETAGESFIIVDDPDGTTEFSPAQVRELSNGHAGLIRAVPCGLMLEHEVEGDDPLPTWFFDFRLPDGSSRALSGNGLRVYVRHLLDRGLVRLEDRRETIAIGTRVGTRDVLTGAAGVAVDLGRWRFLADDETGFRFSIGGAEVSVIPEGSVPPARETVVTVDPRATEVIQGIGQASARVYKARAGQVAETPSSGIGAIGAALALRHWAYRAEDRHVPHHWRILMPGGALGVRMFPTESGEHVSVSGP